MKILFKRGAEKQFSSAYRREWRYPKQVEIKLLAAENFILQAVSLQDIANYPPFRFHALKGDRKHEWSIRLGNTGYRVTMIPCDGEGNELRGGDILARCRAITIVMVTEVSNHYE